MSDASLPDSPELLYGVNPEAAARARVQDFLRWLRQERGSTITGWRDLRAWSVDSLEEFWGSVWDYFGVQAHTPHSAVLSARTMPGAEWFAGATINYAERCFGTPEDVDRVAVVAVSQTRDRIELTFGELADQVRRASAGLRRLGVREGDRVAAYLPNCPEALVAFLATVSIGAIWSACAPEFGSRSVIDRFEQIEPAVLLVVTGYTYGDTPIDKSEDVRQLRAALPAVRHVVHVPYGAGTIEDAVPWARLVQDTSEPLSFQPVPFAHPLFILFSSGTTGQPKAIVHSHGGILLEHLKNHSFHWDLGPGDRLLWFTTTAWMMWNTLVSALLVRSSLVMIDGNPLHPGLRFQWQLAESTGATLMGASPGYLMACRKEGVRPGEEFDLSRLRQLGVAGSPFVAEGFRWVAEQFGDRVLLNVGSGGTDVCTGVVQGSPLDAVWIGEMSGSSLAVDARAYDEDGKVVAGELGELVIASPMPSMPIGFWGDEDGSRFQATYFDMFPGVFRFGDWCRFSAAGSCAITGRSDATLNRGGVRLGTMEFYRVLEDLPQVTDSVVIHLEDAEGGLGELILFMVPAAGVVVDDDLKALIVREIRAALSPRHIPDRIVTVSAVPYSRTGKKLEIPVKRIVRGATAAEVASPGALMDPAALDPYVLFARDWDGAR